MERISFVDFHSCWAYFCEFGCALWTFLRIFSI